MTQVSVPLSILDLAIVGRDQTVADALANSVVLAQRAEALGYRRVWYAEHHNMASIASSAPAVLIAHVAAHTSTIRLGAGGVMLPNHSPLTIAEQYGTLAALHPGRIDLGLGRAPGSDQATMRAMRRDHTSSDTFPEDVLELQGYLTGETRVPGVRATPGDGTDAFASHFAPAALRQAVAIYRDEFRPSAQLAEPYVLAAVNVVAATTDDEADEQFRRSLRARVSRFLGAGDLPDDEADRLIASPQGRQIAQMMHYAAVGGPSTVGEYLQAFTEHAQADELVLAHAAPLVEERLRSLELVAEVAGLVTPAAP
jgi:alkanesulfonate monooxygenase SsuD/methylene tetrahydromethanopterin reductase-like flavin-dependent oxidoreductase (luciferase family)